MFGWWTFRGVVGRGAVVFAAVLFCVPFGVEAQSFTPIDLSDAVGGGSGAAIALSPDGKINVAWQGDGIFFRRSADGGTTFSNAQQIQSRIGPIAGPQMAVDASGNINLLWSVFVGATPDVVYFSRSTDAGATFSTPLSLAVSPGARSTQLQMTLDSNGHIDIVWKNTDLFFSTSADGRHFSAAVKVWTVADDVADLRVAAAGTHVYVLWSHIASGQCDILFGVSANAGSTFASPANISNAPGTCSLSPMPSVDSGGNLNVVWVDQSPAVFFSRSTNGGATFAAPTNVAGGTQIFSASGPRLAVDASGQIDVVWTGTLTDLAVFFARSNDHGATFSTPKILSLPPVTNFTGGGDPAVGIDACGDVSVAWDDDSGGTASGDFDIFLARATQPSTRFSGAVNLSKSNVQAEVLPQVALDARGNTYVVWETTPSGANSTLTPNVFFSRVGAAEPQAGSFRLRIAPAVRGARPGDTVGFEIITQASSFRGEAVELSCSDLPAFATCTFHPAAVSTRRWIGVSTLSLNTPSTLPFGAYLFAVNGVSTSHTDTQTVEVFVSSQGNVPASASSVEAADSENPLAGSGQGGCSTGGQGIDRTIETIPSRELPSLRQSDGRGTRSSETPQY